MKNKENTHSGITFYHIQYEEENRRIELFWILVCVSELDGRTLVKPKMC